MTIRPPFNEPVLRGLYFSEAWKRYLAQIADTPTMDGDVLATGSPVMTSTIRDRKVLMKHLALMPGLSVIGALSDGIPTTLSWTQLQSLINYGIFTRVMNISGVNNSSPVDGDFWRDLTQMSLAFNMLGLREDFVGCIFTQTADLVTSGTTETTIIGTGVGSLTIPINYAKVGKTLRIKSYGLVTTQAIPGTLQLKLKLGTTTVGQTDAFTHAISLTDILFFLDLTGTIRSVGATGTIMVNGTLLIGASMYRLVDAAATIDTTGALTIDVTSTNSVAGGTVITTKNATVELLK